MDPLVESTASHVTPPVLPGERTRRALIVVEDSFACGIFADKLRTRGFAVQGVENSESAWEQLRTFCPDVTFLLFSKRSGTAAEFIKKVRQDPELDTQPICICTLWSSLRTTTPLPGAEPTKYYNLLSTSIDHVISEATIDVNSPGTAVAEESVVQVNGSQLCRKVDQRFKEGFAAARASIETLSENRAESMRAEKCVGLAGTLHSLVVYAAVTGMCAAAQYAAAMESLFDELSVEGRHLTDSCLQTIASAVETLEELQNTFCDRGEQGLSGLHAVVFADADNTRLETLAALTKAGFETSSFSRQESAVAHLKRIDADLIVIQSHTSEAEIADLCKEIRGLAKHRKTPLIVAGSAAQFARPECVLSVGASEIVFHPFATAELALKGLTLIQKQRPSVGVTSESIALESQREQPALNLQFPPLAPQKAKIEDPPMNSASETLEGQSAAPAEWHGPEQDHQRCQQLEGELEAFNRRYLDLDAKLALECKNVSEGKEQIKKLKEQLHTQSEELQKTKKDLGQIVDKRAQFEAEKASLAEENRRIQSELTLMRETCAAAEKRAETASEAAPTELRIRMGADLELERAEKRRLEQRLAALAKDLEELHARTSEYFECERVIQGKLSTVEQRLQERDEALARATADLQKETAERCLAVEQLRAAEALVAELRDGGAVFASARNALQRRHEELEARLQVATSAVKEAQSHLQSERRERTKLEEELTALQRLLQEQKIETSKLECAHEVGQAERKRLEGDAIQLRYASVGAARASLVALNQLQNEVREPLDKIVAATRRLLELEIGEDTNKLVQCVLVNGLEMQNRLQEFTPPPTPFGESQPLAAIESLT